jgi:integrase
MARKSQAADQLLAMIRTFNTPADGPRPKEALPHAPVHDLRQIHATTPLLNGVPVHVVAARVMPEAA